MRDTDSPSESTSSSEQRRDNQDRTVMGGTVVREADADTLKGIRAIVLLFRGMAILLLILMALRVFFGLTSVVPLSVGVMVADAVRLIVFAGLLWGGGELAVLWVKSHHDIRAQRILTARIAYMMQQELGSRRDRAT